MSDPVVGDSANRAEFLLTHITSIEISLQRWDLKYCRKEQMTRKNAVTGLHRVRRLVGRQQCLSERQRETVCQAKVTARRRAADAGVSSEGCGFPGGKFLAGRGETRKRHTRKRRRQEGAEQSVGRTERPGRGGRRAVRSGTAEGSVTAGGRWGQVGLRKVLSRAVTCPHN